MSAESSRVERIGSIDALRGFDMIWISGGESIIHALSQLTGWTIFAIASENLEHVPWEGFHFYDLIFPLFLFISGVTIPIATARRLSRGESKRSIALKFLRRALLLVFFGVMYNGLFRLDWANLRYASVLGRIGIAYFFASVIALHSGIRTQVIWTAVLLLLYWAAMMLIPVPGGAAGVLTPEGSLEAYVDRLLLPGKLYFGSYDPEGILSTIPAISTALLGVLTGHFITSPRWSKAQKALRMFGAGVILIAAGYAWGMEFPIVKNIWTSSFVLVAGGWSLVLLACFYALIDVAGWKKWAFLFIVIGFNPLTIYLTQAGIINFDSTVAYFFGTLFQQFSEPVKFLCWAIAMLALKVGFLYFLFRQKISLRV
jgi:predicted acyltransferase